MRRALLTGPALARYNLFDNLTPQYNDNGDATGFTYGTRFFSDAAGAVVAIRFYKGLNNGGGNSHTVALYDSSGTLLASAATANEPASGWVTTNLPSPVAIAANTPYTAAVFFPAGHAVYSDAFFSSQYNSPPLHAYAASNGGNGVYNLADTLQFPTENFNEGYFIDAVVETGGTPLPPTPPPSGTMLIGAYESVEALPYAQDTNISRLDALANAGFKLVVNYGTTSIGAHIGDMLWYADRCHERGMKLTWELRFNQGAYWSTGTAVINARPTLAADVGGSNDQQFMTNLINALKTHPATYAYYIGDEPGSDWYPYIKQHAQLIRATDPSTDRHVLALLGWWYATPEELDLLNSPDIDLIGIDYYPWNPRDSRFLPANQDEWINMTNRIASVYQWCEQHGKLFIGVPQAFGFDAYDCIGTANSWPTESAMQSFNSIWRAQAPNMASMVLYSYFDAVKDDCATTRPADFWQQAIRAFQVGQ